MGIDFGLEGEITGETDLVEAAAFLAGGGGSAFCNQTAPLNRPTIGILSPASGEGLSGVEVIEINLAILDPSEGSAICFCSSVARDESCFCEVSEYSTEFARSERPR